MKCFKLNPYLNELLIHKFVIMNLARQTISSAIKSTLNHKPSINISILETHLHKCQNFYQFNQILSQMIIAGLIKDAFAASRILKFSTDSFFIHVNYSLQVFNQIENSNGFIWNIMMKCCVNKKCSEKAMALYKSMLEKNVGIDNYTHPILVHASAIRGVEFEGRMIHCHVLEMGFDSDVYVGNTLINMYCVCGNVMDARKVFDKSTVLDSVSWNSILAGYVEMGNVVEAKLIYDSMPEKNVIASNSMIVLFGRVGRVDEASRLFDEMLNKDVVSWSALISCYEQNGMYEEALMAFRRMVINRVTVDEVVGISTLSACAHLFDLNLGKAIHGLGIRTGIESCVSLQNALILMYSNCGELLAAKNLFDSSNHLDQISYNSMICAYLKCGSVQNARKLFDSMPKRDIVSWSAMISGYAQNDKFSEMMALFNRMQIEGVIPDETTLVSVISACSHLPALDQGKWVHFSIRKNSLKVSVVLGTALIDFYMKCGCVESALEMFYGMEEKWVSTWNALIIGLSLNGLVKKSLQMYIEMKECGMMPNEITFVGVLGACRHMGLVAEGRQYFESMIREYNIEPNIKHYSCMVDLLGRAGWLQEAEQLIDTMPMKPDVTTWGALLAACEKHGNNEMGQRIGRKLIEAHPDHDGFHVLLSNFYASIGDWDDVLDIRTMMINKESSKSQVVV